MPVQPADPKGSGGGDVDPSQDPKLSQSDSNMSPSQGGNPAKNLDIMKEVGSKDLEQLQQQLEEKSSLEDMASNQMEPGMEGGKAATQQLKTDDPEPSDPSIEDQHLQLQGYHEKRKSASDAMGNQQKKMPDTSQTIVQNEKGDENDDDETESTDATKGGSNTGSLPLGGGTLDQSRSKKSPSPALIVIGLILLFVVTGGLAVAAGLFEDEGSPEADVTKPPVGDAPDNDSPGANLDAAVTQPPVEGATSCECRGVDYLCFASDGTVTSASYNSDRCGGSGACACREPNAALACPDGTYAEFNPACGVGGGSSCTLTQADCGLDQLDPVSCSCIKP